MPSAAPGASLPSKRICIVLLSGIGDVVHGLPIVNALKRDDPERHVTWVVQSEAAPLLASHPAVDEVVTFDRKRGLGEIAALWKKLRPKRFDLLLNFNIYFKSAVVTFVARASNKVSFGRDRARDAVWLLANHRIPPRRTTHTLDRFIEFLDYIGVPAEPIEWRLPISEDERRAQREFFQPLSGRPVIGLVPTSGRSEKDWPTESYAEVATAATRAFGCHVLLLGGPGLREGARARAVAASAEVETTWALGPDLRRLVYLIDGCDLIIAPDTGPLHIARALDTPVIGIYWHTDPSQCGPYGAFEELTVDRFNYDGPGAPARDLPRRSGEGRMTLVRIDDVLEKVELAMKRYVRSARSGKGSA